MAMIGGRTEITAGLKWIKALHFGTRTGD